MRLTDLPTASEILEELKRLITLSVYHAPPYVVYLPKPHIKVLRGKRQELKELGVARVFADRQAVDPRKQVVAVVTTTLKQQVDELLANLANETN